MAKKKLSPRHRLFVDHYCELLDGSKAARAAGFKGNPNVISTTAHRLLNTPHIAEAIKARLSTSAMTEGEALGRIAEMARADIGEFVDIENNKLVIDWGKAREKSHLIKSIRNTRHGLHIEMHDSQAALDKILKVHGKYIQRLEHTGGDGEPLILRVKGFDDV